MIQSTMNNIQENLYHHDPTLYPHLLIKEEDSSIKKCLTCLIIPCIFIFIILLISFTITSYNNDNSLSE